MIIEPFVGVGNLYFADSRKGIRNKLNENYTEGLKEFMGIKDYYDHFSASEIIVYYDEMDHISAFEFYKGTINFNGINLLAEPYGSLIKSFSELDLEIKIEATGFSSEKYGIAVEAVYAATEDQMASSDSVFIFKKGYYDKLNEILSTL